MAKRPGTKRLWVRRGIPVVVVVLVVAGVAGTRAFASGSDGPSYRLGTVTKGSVDQTLTLSGTVKKASQATSSFKVSGTVNSVPVAIGDEVNAGATLATLDPTALQRAVTAAKATLAQAQATLAADEDSANNVGYDTFTTTSSEVFAIETALVFSSKPSTTPAEAAAAVKKAQAAVSAAQATATSALAALATAQDAQTTSCQAVVAGTATPAQIADCVTAIQATSAAQATAGSAQSALTRAQAALATALSAQAKILASSAGSGSGGSGSSGGSGGSGGSGRGGSGSSGSGSSGSGSSFGSGTERIASDTAAVTTAKAALATAQDNLADATLTAPISGTVAALGYTPGAASGSNSVTIVGPGAVDVTVDVPLASLPLVKVGQAASVASVGSATTVAGTLRSISLLPASSTSTSVSYPVVIRVPDPTPALASGSSATATITLRTVKDVLTVPNSAVTSLVAGTGFVLTVKGGTATRTLVRIGAVGSTRTQVLSGLTAGQQVAIADLSEALPTNTTFGNRFGNRSGSGLTSSLNGGGGVGGGGFDGGPRVFVNNGGGAEPGK